MAKYHYNVEKEAFVREDNKGKPLYVNISEAQKIVLQLDLGYSVSSIEGKVALSNPKGTVTTIRSFIRNYKAGNIEISSDAPAPARVFDDILESNKLEELEERIENLEDIISDITANGGQSFTEKVKEWLKS